VPDTQELLHFPPALAGRAALLRGTYSAQHWEETPVDLYHFPDEGRGFFVEVSIEHKQPVVLRGAVSSVP
jgi:hypothetical protein